MRNIMSNIILRYYYVFNKIILGNEYIYLHYMCVDERYVRRLHVYVYILCMYIICMYTICIYI